MHCQCYYISIQSSILALMELPFPRLHKKGMTSYRESTDLRKTFTSPIIDEYEKVAAKYKNYINDLSPKIQKIYQKENYRDYLKEQKLHMIKSQLFTKKQMLERQLQEKLDPTKSPNGKLHTQILSLTELEANYQTILNEIEKSLNDKQEEIKKLEQFVNKQKQIIKGLLKYDFRQSKQKTTFKFPKITRNSSDSSFLSRDSVKSLIKHSRQSIISKLSCSIMERTNEKLNLEEQKLIMLKLFVVYYHSEEQAESSTKLMESLEKQLSTREDLIKQIKKELASAETQKRAQASNE